MKFGPVTKPGRRNKPTSKKCGNDVLLANCDVIDIFLIMANLEHSESRIPDS